MTDEPSELTVRFDALGRETRNLESWSIDSAYLTSTDGFSFTYLDVAENLVGLEAQPVTLILRDSPQLVGRIDATTQGDSGFTIDCEGRDYIADIVECHVDPGLSVNEGMTLQAAIKAACAPCGIQIVLGDAAVTRKARSGVSPRTRGAPKDFLALTQKEMKPDSEQGIYDWCNRLTARHGCTIQPTLNRNEINLVAPNYDQDAIGTLFRSRASGGSNRIKTAKAHRDFSRFPTYTIARASESGSADEEKSAKNAKGLIDSAKLTPETQRIAVPGRVKTTSTADADGKLYRLLTIHDQQARTETQVNAAAFRAIWDRLKDTLVYTATLRGHRDPDSGAIWTIDTIVNVQDELANVFEPMWIAKRKLSYDPTGGAETQIECWRIGAYQTGNSTA